MSLRYIRRRLTHALQTLARYLGAPPASPTPLTSEWISTRCEGLDASAAVVVEIALESGENGAVARVALGGAVLGSALVYVIPAAMGVASKLQKGKKTPLTTGEKAEVVACGAMGVTGVALGVLGAIMSLKGAAH